MTSIKRKTGLCLLVGFLMLFLTGYMTVYAEETQGDDSKPEYRTGRIDLISVNRVVIDDTQYKFTDKTQFFSKSGRAIQANVFYKGDKVEYMASKKSKLIILRKL